MEKMKKEILINEDDFPLYSLMEELLKVSKEHFDQLEKIELPEESIWMIYRWKTNINESIKKGKKYLVETEILAISKLYCIRKFKIYFENKWIGDILSYWVLANKSTRRLMRFPKEYWTEETGKLPEELKEQKSPPIKRKEKKDFCTEEKDLDENKHVNNLSYIRFLFRHIEQEKDADFQNLEIKYKKEILHPTDLSLYCSRRENEISFEITSNLGDLIHAEGSLYYEDDLT